jgi:hypothetical protein
MSKRLKLNPGVYDDFLNDTSLDTLEILLNDIQTYDIYDVLEKIEEDKRFKKQSLLLLIYRLCPDYQLINILKYLESGREYTSVPAELKLNPGDREKIMKNLDIFYDMDDLIRSIYT